MEVENKLILESDDNKWCGYIEATYYLYCKASNYCSQGGTGESFCMERIHPYRERHAYNYDAYVVAMEPVINQCIEKATVIFSIIKLNSIIHLPSQREFLP